MNGGHGSTTRTRLLRTPHNSPEPKPSQQPSSPRQTNRIDVLILWLFPLTHAECEDLISSNLTNSDALIVQVPMVTLFSVTAKILRQKSKKTKFNGTK